MPNRATPDDTFLEAVHAYAPYLAAETLLHHVPALSEQSHDRRSSVRNWIATLYPPTTRTRPWDDIQPDRLAEHFLGRHFHAAPTLPDSLLPDATPGQAAQRVTVLTRTAANPPLVGGRRRWR